MSDYSTAYANCTRIKTESADLPRKNRKKRQQLSPLKTRKLQKLKLQKKKLKSQHPRLKKLLEIFL